MKRIISSLILAFCMLFSITAAANPQDDRLFVHGEGTMLLFDGLGSPIEPQFENNWFAKDKPTENRVIVRNTETALCGVMDMFGKLIAPFQYTDILPYSEGLAAFQNGEKWGFLDKDGKEVIPAQYEKATSFLYGLAAVWKDGKAGCIDYAGNTALPFSYDTAEVYSRKYIKVGSAAEVRVTAGTSSEMEKRMAFGLCGRDGKVFVPQEYSRIEAYKNGTAEVSLLDAFGYAMSGILDEEGMFFPVSKFSEGLGVVIHEHGVPDSVINEKGETVFTLPEGWSVHNEAFSCGRIRVYNDPVWGVLDTAGNVVIPPSYADIKPFYDGYALFSTTGEKYGAMDTDGNIVVPETYANYESGVKLGENGLAKVQKEKKWGYINTRGEEVIPCIYDKVGDFAGGLVSVEKDKKQGVFSETGAEIIPCVYDSAGVTGDGFIYLINRTGPGAKKTLGGFADTAGNVIVEPQYALVFPCKEGRFRTKSGDKMGHLDVYGNVTTPFLYDLTLDFENGYAPIGTVKNHNSIQTTYTYGIVNDAGECILPPVYNSIFAIYPMGSDRTIAVLLNGEEIAFDQPPIIENGRTLVPLRAICEAMGATVSWDAEKRQAKATLGNKELVFTIDVPAVLVNGIEKPIDQPPVIRNGRTLLPVRAFSEEFGAEVSWDERTQTVSITK